MKLVYPQFDRDLEQLSAHKYYYSANGYSLLLTDTHFKPEITEASRAPYETRGRGSLTFYKIHVIPCRYSPFVHQGLLTFLARTTSPTHLSLLPKIYSLSPPLISRSFASSFVASGQGAKMNVALWLDKPFVFR